MVKTMKEGRLVILAGIDGSGKSTLLSYLEERGYFISHWKRLKKLSLPKPLNFENPAEVVQTLKDQERLDFIWAYISSEWKYLIKPALNIGKNVISDGFFIRFYIKEKIYNKLGVNELLKYSPLTGKEFIIMIDTPPKIAFQRKLSPNISPYECFKSVKDFVEFQSLQRKMLLAFIKDFPYIIINGMLAKEKLVNRVLRELEKNQINPEKNR